MQKKRNNIIEMIRKNKVYIFLFIIIFTLCLIILNSSPLYKGLPEIDSSVFQVMGKGMLENKIMYKDLFDHKGPIVYIINALAFFISNKYGLFIVEVVLFYVGTIFIHKTARVLLTEKTSFIMSLLYIIASFKYFGGGNYTEEYAITFISIALYYIIKILYQKQDDKKIYWIIIGATFAVNMLIKPTYIAVWIAFGLVQLISSIKDKKVKELIKNIGYILIGILIISVPILIYLIINNDITYFIDAYISMNIKYSDSNVSKKIETIKRLIKNYGYMKYLLIIIISNVVILLSKNLINKRTKSFITLFSLFSIFLAGWAPNAFFHYLIQISPAVVIESIFFFYTIEKRLIEKNILNYKIIKELPLNLIYTAIIFVILLNILVQLKNINGIFTRTMKVEQYIIQKTSEISNYLEEDDNILVLGNNSYYYLILEKQPKFRYFFQCPIIEYDEKIKNETEKYILEEKPKIIIDEKDMRRQVSEDEELKRIYGESIETIIKTNYEEHDINFMRYFVLKEED